MDKYEMMENFDSAKIRSAGGAGLIAAPPCNFDAYSTFWQPGNEEMEQMLFSEQKSAALN